MDPHTRKNEIDRLRNRIKRCTSTTEDEIRFKELTGKDASSIQPETQLQKKKRRECARENARKRLKLETAQQRKKRQKTQKLQKRLLRAIGATAEEKVKLQEDYLSKISAPKCIVNGEKTFILPSTDEIKTRRRKDRERKEKVKVQKLLEKDKPLFVARGIAIVDEMTQLERKLALVEQKVEEMEAFLRWLRIDSLSCSRAEFRRVIDGFNEKHGGHFWQSKLRSLKSWEIPEMRGKLFQRHKEIGNIERKFNHRFLAKKEPSWMAKAPSSKEVSDGFLKVSIPTIICKEVSDTSMLGKWSIGEPEAVQFHWCKQSNHWKIQSEKAAALFATGFFLHEMKPDDADLDWWPYFLPQITLIDSHGLEKIPFSGPHIQWTTTLKPFMHDGDSNGNCDSDDNRTN